MLRWLAYRFFNFVGNKLEAAGKYFIGLSYRFYQFRPLSNSAEELKQLADQLTSKPLSIDVVAAAHQKKGGCEVQTGCFRRLDCADDKWEDIKVK